MATRLAKRFACSRAIITSGLHTRGAGAPRSARCRYCGSELSVEEGLWGVFEWRVSGRYPAEDAVRTYSSPASAEKFAETNALVVRWIPSTDIGA